MAEEKSTSDHTEAYFSKVDNEIQKVYAIATKARSKGYDPEEKVDIPIAKNMAERVIGLISAICPSIINTTIPQRIQELEKKYGVLDWRVSLIIAEEIAKEKYMKFKDKKEAMEIGIRVGFAYHTLGTVASPLEGLSEIKFAKNKEGKEYFQLFFSGPIRSAGGTGASVSVLISDYVRKKMGYGTYDPTEDEVKRTVAELYDYHERITNLQYLPSEEEITFLAKHLPVQITGDPSEKIEVSNYKDLPRIETNKIRNGVCLVIGEGIAQKAPKIWKQLSKWGKEFDMEQWNFMEEFVNLQKRIKAGVTGDAPKEPEENKPKIMPDKTFIKDLVAGRPVLTHPMAKGGFRLRYGRSRTSGYSASSISPYTMKALSNYIATGSQLKVERPGKGCVVSCCDTIEGPIVRLKDGTVLRIEKDHDAKDIIDRIDEVLFLGDILFNYGDFLNRAHKLVPVGYCEEWWIQEVEKATVSTFGNLDFDKLSSFLEIPVEIIDDIFRHPLTVKPSSEVALLIASKLNTPLHPRFTYHWKDISKQQLSILAKGLERANIKREDNKISKIILPLAEQDKSKDYSKEETPKRILEIIGVPHLVVNNEFAVIEKEDARPFAAALGISQEFVLSKILSAIENPQLDSLEAINKISEIKLRDKSGIYIGARMGRPEKAKIRKLTGSPQVLFPVGDEGGRMRSFQAALDTGVIKGDFPTYVCKHCSKNTIFAVCEDCGNRTKKKYHCKVCGAIDTDTCPAHGKVESYKKQDIDIRHYFSKAMQKTGMSVPPDLIKGVKGTSNKDHIPEHLLKGILRAKHDLYVNKDGTIRYDMTQMPLTHFKPKEVRTSIDKLKQLGYDFDIHGKPLEDPSQILEIKPLDIVLPAAVTSPDEGADKVMFRATKFCDDLLEKFYGLPPYYNLKSEEDLAGHIGLALAPHTSAAITVRIIGFSNTQGFFAHPMIHAATRRDCDGDEASVTLLMDAFLNFSRQFLPAHKGSTQDAPLVMTSRVIPSEIDDMIFDMDVAYKYPLELYEAAERYQSPSDVQVKTFGKLLNTTAQYEGHGFTHDTTDFNKGIACSAYKLLPSMEEKLRGQMEIAEKVRAVNQSDVARLVIEKHFIRDTKGNLRKFSLQEFRCVKCNEIYRRPPLVGKCIKCDGRIIFTISEGSVIKYLEPSLSLARKYNLPPYLKQSLELLKKAIEEVFGKDKEKQEGLGKWFG